MMFFLFFPENRLSYFMQSVSLRDNLHIMPKPTFWKKNKERNIANCRLLTFLPSMQTGKWILQYCIHGSKSMERRHLNKNLSTPSTVGSIWRLLNCETLTKKFQRRICPKVVWYISQRGGWVGGGVGGRANRYRGVKVGNKRLVVNAGFCYCNRML